jgi:hypothetical protein
MPDGSPVLDADDALIDRQGVPQMAVRHPDDKEI